MAIDEGMRYKGASSWRLGLDWSLGSVVSEGLAGAGPLENGIVIRVYL